MADTNPEDIKIEGSVAIWDINAVGEILGTYIGQFRFRCFLTPMQQIAAGKEERDLLGVNLALANEHERFLAYALSQLKYRIISAPPFWNTSVGGLQGDLPDENVIATILSAAIDSEALYKKQIKERKEAAIKRAKAASDEITKRDLDIKEENYKLENE